MRTREDLENAETKTLSPYACLSTQSLGRQYPELEHNYRTAFQRDRDRILHTSAFRRLEYKTQVFVNSEGDYYRTRLTHTLEVSQIARTVARALGVNEDLTEAISLAHDLGHTPFGHAGQDVMQELMKPYGGFEHNRQSFRIVTALESYSEEFPGLNLSHEVLEGLMKHSNQCELPGGILFVKKGFPSIEAQIANLCDEVAYNNHDIDDGLKSGLISTQDLHGIKLWEESLEQNALHGTEPLSQVSRKQIIKRLINNLVGDIISNTSKCLEEQKISSMTDVRERGRQLVDYSSKTKTKVVELKKFLFAKLYRHPRVYEMSEKGKIIIRDLFKRYQNDFTKIPAPFRFNYAANEPHERIICDYISGMTDRFAEEEWSRKGA